MDGTENMENFVLAYVDFFPGLTWEEAVVLAEQRDEEAARRLRQQFN